MWLAERDTTNYTRARTDARLRHNRTNILRHAAICRAVAFVQQLRQLQQLPFLLSTGKFLGAAGRGGRGGRVASHRRVEEGRGAAGPRSSTRLARTNGRCRAAGKKAAPIYPRD